MRCSTWTRTSSRRTRASRPCRGSRAARPEDQGVRLHRGRRGCDAPVRARHPPARQAGARARGDRRGDHGGAGAHRDARHPRMQHRGADPRRGARGGGPADRRDALGASARAEGRLRREARLLAPVLERDPDPRPGLLRGVHAVLVGAVGDGRARAEGEGADLHRLRRVGDAPLRAGAAAPHQERDRLRRDARGDPRGDRARERDRHPPCTVGVPILVEELAVAKGPDA